MVFICLVKACKNNDQVAKMHRLPRDDLVLKEWLEKVGRFDLFSEPKLSIYENHRICSDHFDPSEYTTDVGNQLVLRTGVIPSLLLPINVSLQGIEQDIHHDTIEMDGQLPTTPGIDDIINTNACIQEQGPSHSDIHEDIGHNTIEMDDQMPSTSRIQEDIDRNTIKMDDQMPSTSRIQEDIDHNTIKMVDQMPSTSHAIINTNACIQEQGPSHSGKKRRQNVLAICGKRNRKHLPSEARKFNDITSKLRRTISKMHEKNKDLKSVFKVFRDACRSLEPLRHLLSTPSFRFLLSRIRCENLKPKERRYSLDEKILFLTLLNSKPEGYELLSKIFAVPSRKTLSKLLHSLNFNSGINTIVMDSIKNKLKRMDEKQKFCSILFDEMPIKPSLQYNKAKDLVEGFQDNGPSLNRSPNIADKVMVFMARGVFRRWKQPLAYFFSDGGMKGDVLSKLIKDIVRSCQDSGLHVVALICDQGSANVAAINQLYKETTDHYSRQGEENLGFGVLIGGHEVVPLYDPPHLLKGIRSNFFNKTVHFKWRTDHVEVGEWQHLKMLYIRDVSDDFKLCRNLCIQLLENSETTKVSLAAQAFSHRVAAIMRLMAVLGILPAEAVSTAEFIFFMDKVFDSVNGSVLNNKQGKDLRCGVTSKSPHKSFWAEAVKVFESMEFINERKEKIVPPSIKNWIHTLKALSYLWGKLQQEGIRLLLPRRLNQDPLENYLASIRSHGIRNTNPNAMSFQDSFVLLIINNFLSIHSKSSNCKKDSLVALDDLKHMLNATNSSQELRTRLPEISVGDYIPDCSSLLRRGGQTYVASYLAKRILKKIKTCHQCRSDLIGGNRSDPEYFGVMTRAPSLNSLLAPSTNYNYLFQKSIFISSGLLPQICCESNILEVYKTILMHNSKENLFNCDTHNVIDIFYSYFVKFHLVLWLKNINNILRGKRKFANTTDDIKIIAFRKFENHIKLMRRIAASE